jgi:hypothetical protein
MKTKNHLLTILSIVGITLATQAVAQEEEESTATPITISGSVDTYFRTNLNSLNYGSSGATVSPGTSFADGTGFSLGMANLILTHTGEKSGVVADLVFGPRGEAAVFGSGPSNNIVNQLYVYLNLSENTTLTLGNFNTFLGYEVISPTGNFNYSTSYMFSFGPFSHTGAKADFTFGKTSLMLGVFNTTDVTETNPDDSYFGGAQLGFGGAYLNFLFNDTFFQADITGGWDVSESLYLGVNATTASDNFTGGALYVQSPLSDAFKLGLRGEYFQDNGLGVFELDESVMNLTLTGNYTTGNLTIIPEVRLDSYSQKDFVITDVPSSGTPKYAQSLSSFLIAAVYSF